MAWRHQAFLHVFWGEIRDATGKIIVPKVTITALWAYEKQLDRIRRRISVREEMFLEPYRLRAYCSAKHTVGERVFQDVVSAVQTALVWQRRGRSIGVGILERTVSSEIVWPETLKNMFVAEQSALA